MSDLEIGKEYPPEGEDEAIAKLRELHLKVQHVKPGANLRGEHPKQHAGLWASFQIRDDIPAEYRIGIFAEPRTYKAVVRYSNGRTEDDREADVHGMAVKVLIPQGGEDRAPATQQDFILADHPVFFGKSVHHTYEFLAATSKGIPAAVLALTTHHKLLTYTNKSKASLLNTTYWSQTPYKLGDGAVKYLLTPAEGSYASETPANDSPDFRREMLLEQLTYAKIGAQFDFCIHPQTDAEAMPVEDSTVEWTSTPVLLARVLIEPQNFGSKEQMTFVENLTWSPWHCLPQHAPLGGINRARRPIYTDSQELRLATNGVQPVVLTGRESFE